MADFGLAYNKTNGNEGGYSHDPNDNGGETWKGIARNMHPSWAGWRIVDGYRKDKHFPNVLVNDKSLELYVRSFYKLNFWNIVRGDEISNQEEADDIYDFAVNSGPANAIKKVQLALSSTPSGVMDDATLNKLNNK